MKKILLGLVVAFLFTGCQYGADTVSEVPKEESNVIKIGAIGPLTGDGASYGVLFQNVAEMRVKEINENGGINGKNLELVWEDGKCAPADASRAAQKLINMDKMNVILGGFCSGETLGAAPITEKKSVILLSPGSSSPEVTNAGDFVFRTAPSDNSQGAVLAQYANDQGFEKVGVIMEQTDYSVGVMRVFESEFSGEIEKETFLSSESDYKTRITKLKNADIDALLLIVQTPVKAGILAKQLQEQNWEMPIFGSEMLCGDTEVASKHAEFLSLTKAVCANFVAPDNEKFKAFIAKYEAEIGETPQFQNYVAIILDAVDVLAEVLSSVDQSNTEAIRDALYAYEGEGMFGPLQFDENGDVNITHSLFQFDGEKFVLMGE